MIIFDHTDPHQWLAYAILIKGMYKQDTQPLWHRLTWELECSKERAVAYVQEFAKATEARRKQSRRS